MSNIPYLTSSAVRSATRSLLLAAAATASGFATPAMAALPEPGLAARHAHAETDELISLAREQLAAGQPKHALETLTPALRDIGSLSASDRGTVMSLIGQARAAREAQPKSRQHLEDAEIALEQQNLAIAERKATAVLAMADATSADRSRASSMVTDIAQLRAEFAQQVPGLLVSLQDDFASGQYARGKATLDAIRTSGVPLNDAQNAIVDHHLTMLFELERVNGAIDHTPYAAGVFQAGVVKRRKDEPQPADQPASQPAAEPTSEPAAEPAAATGQMAPSPSEEELRRQAEEAQRLEREASERARVEQARAEQASLEAQRRSDAARAQAEQAASEARTGQMDPIEVALLGEPTAQPVVEPATAPVTEPASQPTVQPVAEPVAEPMAQEVQDDPESTMGQMTPISSSQPQAAPNQPEPTPQTAQPQPQMAEPAPQQARPGGTPDFGAMAVQDGQQAAPGGSLIDQALRIEAQSVIANADDAFDKAQYARAEGLYFNAQQYSQYLTADQIRHVSDRLAETRLQLGDRGGSFLDQELSNRGAQSDRARTVISNLIEQSRGKLETGLTELALTDAEAARSELNRNQDVLSASQYQSFDSQIDDLIGSITQRSLELAETQAREQEREAVSAAEAKELDRVRKKEARLREALDRVRALQAERRYREALAVVEQDILFIDPLNPAGLLLRDILREADIYNVFNQTRREMNLRLSENALANMEAVLPPQEIIEYPANWPALSNSRLGGLSDFETAEDRATLGRLGLNPVEARFADNRLGDVLTFIEQVADVPMDVDWRSLEEIGIDPETEVSLNLPQVPPRRILDAVAERVSDIGTEADWAVQDGIVIFASKDRLRKRTALNIYDIGDLVVEVPDYDQVPEIDLQQALQSNEGGGQSPFQDEDQDVERIPLEDRIRLVRDIIEQNVDPEHWDVDGFIQEYGKSLIVRTSPKNHRQVQGLLSKLRSQRAIQINAEVRFLLVSQDFFEQIGFDFDVYFNANNNQVRTARAGDPTILPSDFFNFSPSGGGGAGVQRAVTGSVAPNGPVTGAQNTALTQGVIAPDPWSPIGAPGNSLGLAETLFPAEGIASSVLSAAPALGIAGQFLDDVQVDFLIEATQADRRTVTLTAPRLTFMNGQIANIVVGTQIAFISDLQPVVSDSAVGFDPELDTVVEGVTLLLEGTVSADRRYVQMNVDAAVAEVIAIESEEVVAVAGGQLVSSTEAGSAIGLPTTTVTRVQTTVNVPDQGTALLGGQRIVSEAEVETGVPVLSKIPILNRFFSNRIESRDESTLMILLKPTILIQGEEEERQHPGLGSELSRFGG